MRIDHALMGWARGFVVALWDRVRPARWRRKPQPAAAPPRKRRRLPSRASEVEETGRWYFRRDILNRLDEYFAYLKQMRRSDPDAYAVYSRLGAHIVTRQALFDMGELTPYWRQHHGAFGAAVLLAEGNEDPDKWLWPQLSYYQKKARNPRIEMVDPDDSVYSVTVFFALRPGQKKAKWLKYGVPCEFHVAVSPDGQVRTLREWRMEWQSMPGKASRMCHRKRKPMHAGRTTFGSPVLAFPEWLQRAMNRGQSDGSDWFRGTAYAVENANGDIQVRARRGKLTGVFSIDTLRTPYFFRDRDPSFTESGAKKRIFHIVRTHARVVAGGVRYVRSHFRGEREFRWNGYDVLVTMPGKHHNSVFGFDVASHDAEDIKDERAVITSEEMAERLAKHVEGNDIAALCGLDDEDDRESRSRAA